MDSAACAVSTGSTATGSLVVDDNDRGKSTLLAAIVAALYGLSDDKRTHRPITPLDRWRPWDSDPSGR